MAGETLADEAVFRMPQLSKGSMKSILVQDGAPVAKPQEPSSSAMSPPRQTVGCTRQQTECPDWLGADLQTDAIHLVQVVQGEPEILS
ncbi:hypothetical protein MHYP_G00317440 [Metynnis hypsauchen]